MDNTYPDCYRPATNEALYPLCVGMDNPQDLALNDCYTCALYIEYEEEQ